MKNRTLHLAALILLAAGVPALSETLVATHTIRSRSILTAEDLTVVPDAVPGALTHPLDAIGMEARVALYSGRPIRRGDLVAPALIERNQIVPLHYNRNGLLIITDGRSLERVSEGDSVRVMNLQSRTTVTGTVGARGQVFVGGSARTPTK